MKRKIFTLIFTLILGSMTAQKVSQEMAEKVAANFFLETISNSFQETKYPEIHNAITYVEMDAGNPIYYIINYEEGGFVIVSGNLSFYPILGYDSRGSFETEEMPANISYWMEQYARQIKHMYENDMPASPEMISNWDRYLGIPDENYKKETRLIEPLLTTTWNQQHPYNLCCPFDSSASQFTLTGCHATALAQIAYYWGWPYHGQGFTSYVPESNPEFGTLNINYEDTYYRYSEMTDHPGTDNIAVAEYIYHFAAAFHTDFALGSSMPGSVFMNNPELACDSIAYHFRFNPLQWIYRDSMPDDDWKDTLRGMIDMKSPVFYAGYSNYPTSGHMFVCDGYQDDSYFHFNFGWGGSCDGFYHIDSIRDYNSNQFCFSLIRPDTLQANYPPYAAGADTLTYLEGNISDGSGPLHNYQNNTYASWLIDPQNEMDSVTNLEISVKRLDILDDGDKLKIYDGADNSAPLLAELSGNSIPGDIISSGNTVFVEFETNASGSAGGFYLIYQSVVPVWCSGVTQVIDSSGYIDDGSGSFYYNNRKYCEWSIDPGLNQPLTMYFMYFDTEKDYDVLTVLDGANGQTLAVLSGAFQTPPDPVTSPSGKITLKFRTNKLIRGQGWEVTFNTTAIHEQDDCLQANVWPNPVRDRIHVEIERNCTLLRQTSADVQIVNYQGKEVYRGSHKGVFELDLSAYAPGLYFLRVHNGNRYAAQKLIKL